ncbi:MAG TPA: hypothetical protein VK850_00400 [Candidatus Binatia bacterium]|nr:hypothetical protein [Candidatus Binatia bacterium]
MKATPEIEKLLATPEPPELGPGPRKGVLPEKALNAELDKTGASELARAAVLVWHDHLDSAHKIVQDIETPDGSYIHAIIHRREPDYSNSKYWFRRVGDHVCFAELSIALRQKWDPLAFVDACERHDEKTEPRLREIQGTELRLLIEHLL